MTTDWDRWHDPYADPTSALSKRLVVVQRHITAWLDATGDTSVWLLSVCAGDGRDVLGVLAARPDADRVQVTLLESDPRNAGRADAAALDARLGQVDVRCVDAGCTDAYLGVTPTDLLLLCGIFGNIGDDDVARTVSALPQLCSTGATVIWTRSRRAPDLTPVIRTRLAEAGLDELDFTAPPEHLFSVGVHRFVGEPQPLETARRLFDFLR